MELGYDITVFGQDQSRKPVAFHNLLLMSLVDSRVYVPSSVGSVLIIVAAVHVVAGHM